jgi:hypothetical protein
MNTMIDEGEDIVLEEKLKMHFKDKFKMILKFDSKNAYKKDKQKKNAAQALKFLRKLGRKMRKI